MSCRSALWGFPIVVGEAFYRRGGLWPPVVQGFAQRDEFLFHVEKEPKDARGSAQDGHFVSIFAVPLEPPLRGLSLGVSRAVPARKI